jgi:hypothetical protein
MKIYIDIYYWTPDKRTVADLRHMIIDEEMILELAKKKHLEDYDVEPYTIECQVDKIESN